MVLSPLLTILLPFVLLLWLNISIYNKTMKPFPLQRTGNTIIRKREKQLGKIICYELWSETTNNMFYLHFNCRSSQFDDCSCLLTVSYSTTLLDNIRNRRRPKGKLYNIILSYCILDSALDVYFCNSSHCPPPSLDCALAVGGVTPAVGGQLQLQLPDLRPGGGRQQKTIRRGAGAEPGPGAGHRALIIVKQKQEMPPICIY